MTHRPWLLGTPVRRPEVGSSLAVQVRQERRSLRETCEEEDELTCRN
ncbi:hypothetical protein E2C01_067378 [Portunus trituberculatus]|uniref:Uncharacterized protein n=1 Tax=Portunus trituberculatus TaxID=210409 RepID=A0A5B7HKU2_PORTR|nr:hypothetical protein [Portunus trituberculatus]